MCLTVAVSVKISIRLGQLIHTTHLCQNEVFNLEFSVESLNKLEKESSQGMEESKQHGGVRANAGRPKGTGNKLTAKDLLTQCETTLGKPFALSLMEGYRDSILAGDTKTRVTYEKIIVDKVATTMLDVEVEDRGEAVDGKKAAFIDAVQALKLINFDKEINNQKDNDNASD